jgi:hypothetical protein
LFNSRHNVSNNGHTEKNTKCIGITFKWKIIVKNKRVCMCLCVWKREKLTQIMSPTQRKRFSEGEHVHHQSNNKSKRYKKC